MADLSRGNASDSRSPLARHQPARRPSLLPAFEPFSSSPGLPRPAKRKLDDLLDDRKSYPTPVPTSSTGIIPSSSPARRTRPDLQRAVSTLSERAPLGRVPTLDLPANGEPVLMGRSSNSSDYQLSSNRAISRVHVRASYLAPTLEHALAHIEVECLGWNGCKLHCRGEVIELQKGEVFVSDRITTEIMLDVQDTRVMLKWPADETGESLSVTPKAARWASESPSKKRALSPDDMASSPPAVLPPRPATPASPTPNVSMAGTFSSTFRANTGDGGQVHVYEDHSSDEDAPCEIDETAPAQVELLSTESCRPDQPAKLSPTTSNEGEELSEHDEENDPIITSFGPFGENLLSRLDSFKATSPEGNRKPLGYSHLNSPGKSMSSPPKPKPTFPSPIKNHVINQLAFSRIHSLPLSTIHSNLPSELRGAMARPSDTENREVLTTAGLKTILDDIPCVGEISREGKDAAGKLLESEFYYMPEQDTDEIRRETVMQSLGKTSIRAARKSHKQYYWKRPRH